MSSNFSWNIRVYYEDTDTGGVVFYANYLKFFERARTEWLRAMGFSQQVLAQTRDIIFVVKTASVNYHAPAQLDDELNVTVAVRRMSRVSMEIVQEAWRTNGAKASTEPLLLATGEVKVVCVDARIFRPCEIPSDIAVKISQDIA